MDKQAENDALLYIVKPRFCAAWLICRLEDNEHALDGLWIPVVLPDEPGQYESRDAAIAAAERWGYEPKGENRLAYTARAA